MAGFIGGCLFAASGSTLFGAASVSQRVILDEVSVENLGVRTRPVQAQDFEETFFALGRIEAMPSHEGVVSSRVAGRIQALHVVEGDRVKAGDVVAVLESRQPGDPPPLIELVAPMGGMVMRGHVRLGEPVEPDGPILELLDLSQVYAIAQIPEDQANLLSLGAASRIRVPALGERVFQAALERLSTEVDEQSGTVGAIFVLANPEDQLRPHMRAEFSVVVRSRQNVLSIPRSAVIGDSVGQSVFVVEFGLPNTFLKTPVQLGMKNDQFVEILRGVFPGDDVVVEGAYPLAFAGEGTISLKEALDAAHGHEHNEDGSEMTAADRARTRAEKAREQGGAPVGFWTYFLQFLVLILIGLLGVSQWQLSRLRNAQEADRA